MTRDETVALLGVITATIPNAKVVHGTAAAWHELLGDLDFPTAKAATLRVLETHTGAWLLPPALIRQAAAALAAPRDPDPDEAWALVQQAMRRWGWMEPHRAYTEMPPLVATVARGMGWRALCEGAADVARGQFRRAYETALARARQAAALPPGLQDGALAPLPAGRDRPALADVVDLRAVGRRVP